MKKLKLLWMILKRTKATQILSGYIVFLFVSAAIIQLVEPDINHYGDALWYCYAVLSTAGFGDIVAITFIGKLVSVLVTIYTIFVVAIVTGVVVNYYGQIVEMQRRETAMMFLDKLERLPELSKEELEKRCSDYIEIQTEDAQKVCTVLETLGIHEYKVTENHVIHIYEALEKAAWLNTELVKQGCVLDGFPVAREKLENYFLELTGGAKNV